MSLPLSFALSILEAGTDPGLLLSGWLPSTSTSFYENKSQLDVKHFGEEAKGLIKTQEYEARIKTD